MPSKSNKQRRFIFAKRNKYKSSKNTPDNWKWIWNNDWTHVKEHVIKKFNEFKNSIL